MALKLSKEHKSGCLVEYHRIHGINYQTDSLNITLLIYKDKAAKIAKKAAIEVKDYKMPKASYTSAEPDRSQCYTYLKSLPEFAGAEDC